MLLESTHQDLRSSVSASPVLSAILAGHEKHARKRAEDHAEPVCGSGSEYMMGIEALLLRGQREDALTAALEAQDWPMAMMLACVCGPEKYQEVVRSYAHVMFPQTSALHLLSMVYSNQGPKVIGYNSAGAVHAAKFISPTTTATNTTTGGAKAEGPALSGLMSNWRSNLAGLLANKTGEWEALVKLFGARLMNEKHVRKRYS
jgi:hypothetical protein